MKARMPQTSRISGARRIVIANYSGYNIGDDAIFESLLAIVYRACGSDVLIDALTALPERTRERYQVAEVEHIYTYLRSTLSRRRVLAMLAQADLLLIGGGDIVEGQLALLALTALATLVGTPVAYVGVGVLLPPSSRRQRMLRWSANQARFIATREPESERLLHALGVHRPVIQTLPDLAVGFKHDSSDAVEQLLAREDITVSRPYIALNLRPPDPEQYSMIWGEVEFEAIAQVCRVLVDRDGFDIVCISLVSAAAHPPLPAATPSDDQLLLTLAQRIARPGRIHVLRGDYRPGEIAGILRQARLAIGMRLHFLVLSANGGVPLVALSYAHKVRAFMHNIGLERFCIDAAGVDAASLLACIDGAGAERRKIMARLAKWRCDAVVQLKILEMTLAALSRQRSPRGAIRRAVGCRIAQMLLFAVYLYGKVKESLV